MECSNKEPVQPHGGAVTKSAKPAAGSFRTGGKHSAPDHAASPRPPEYLHQGLSGSRSSLRMSSFLQWKRQSRSRLDGSKKGSEDAAISHVLALLNGSEDYFTTSSCSGRVLLLEGVPNCGAVQKRNCVWLYVSHQTCSAEDLVCSLADSTGDAVLKFEPFVLHVQCRRLEDAQLVHTAAMNSGLRNSGLSVGKAGKIIAAVRSTHGLEVPLSRQGRLLVGQEYVHFLVQIANQKMEENLRRIERFYLHLRAALLADPPQELQPPAPAGTGLQIQGTDGQDGQGGTGGGCDGD